MGILLGAPVRTSRRKAWKRPPRRGPGCSGAPGASPAAGRAPA